MSDPSPDSRPALQRHAGKISAASLAAAIALATPLILAKEGTRHIGYRDVAHIATSCTGHTGKDAIVDRHYSDAECNTQLANDLSRTANGIAPCIHVPVPRQSLAAFISFSFNVGAGGFCRSTVARDLNAGHLRTACTDMSAWVYAGGHKVQGLANRRASEVALCLSGVPR